jgi:succinate dehydrogenase / fumarate reductase cytochrome b subunit
MPGKNNKRPIYLDLLHIHLPVGGMVSILHRVSGVLLVAFLPLAILLLQLSLADEESFTRIVSILQRPAARVALLFAVAILAHHFFAGLRHLLLDIDIGIGRRGSRRGAWLTLAAVVVTTLGAGAGLFS